MAHRQGAQAAQAHGISPHVTLVPPRNHLLAWPRGFYSPHYFCSGLRCEVMEGARVGAANSNESQNRRFFSIAFTPSFVIIHLNHSLMSSYTCQPRSLCQEISRGIRNLWESWGGRFMDHPSIQLCDFRVGLVPPTCPRHSRSLREEKKEKDKKHVQNTKRNNKTKTNTR